MPNPPRLYADLSHLWPHLSPPEQYADECATLIELIDQALGSPPPGEKWSVLELGAGAGHGLSHLKQRYRCTAADLSGDMLELGKRLNPDIPAIQADMRSMRIEQRFDAVLLCDAIDYMVTTADAAAALATAAHHLRPGGLVLFAPTYTAETFVDRDIAHDTVTLSNPPGDQTITYISFVHDPDPDDQGFEMMLLYLMPHAETGRVEVVEDRHACGLFSIEQWQQIAEQAGLHAEALAEPAEHTPEGEPSAWSVLFRATNISNTVQ